MDLISNVSLVVYPLLRLFTLPVRLRCTGASFFFAYIKRILLKPRPNPQVADRSPGVGLVVKTAVDWAPHRYMRRSQGGGGGGTADWKRALDDSLLLQRSGEHDGR